MKIDLIICVIFWGKDLITCVCVISLWGNNLLKHMLESEHIKKARHPDDLNMNLV